MDFNVEKVTKDIITFIRNYYKENNLGGAVIGISGGKDSAVVAGLFTLALGKNNVKGIWMPCHSKNIDYQDAIKLEKQFGFKLLEYDLTKTYDNYVKDIKRNFKVDDHVLHNSNINIKPRLRMLTLYYFAAMLSELENKTYIVPGTSNKCEIYSGYFTKGGDNVSDILVLSDLTVDEVIMIGDYIGVPYEICHKTPDDGLSGKSDEEKLGVKYSEIKEVIKEEETGISSSLKEETREKILKLHQKSLHKYKTPAFKKVE